MRATLARRSLGSGSLWIFSVGASSPLTVLIGGIVSTYALTGNTGVPLSFAAITPVVALLAVGYVAMARYVVHPAPFYALLARGVHPAGGIAGGMVAQLAYNAIQISMYPLFGVTMSEQLGGAWWAWAAGAWVLVGVLGLQGGSANAKVLGGLLALELAVIVLFDIAAFFNPAGGVISWAGLAPSNLVVDGLPGVLVLGMAAFVGAESPPAFGEEARSGAVSRATFSAVGFLGVFYLIAALAFSIASGPGQVVDAARDQAQGPFALLGRVFGPGVVTLAAGLLATSLVAAMSAFHNTVARYTFAMARERVLFSLLAKVSRGGVPRAGSLLQSVIAAVVVAGFAIAGAAPMATMFTWLSTVGAMGVLTLLVAASLAARRYFARGGGVRDSVFTRHVAPLLGSVLGALFAVMMLSNLGALLNTAPGSRLPWLAPALIGGFAVTGVLWAAVLRYTRSAVLAGVGHGTPDPLTVRDQRLAALEV